MSRLKSFSPLNPTGEAAGMEPVRLDVLRSAVDNANPVPTPESSPTIPSLALSPPPQAAPLINKNVRLPADLVDFIDYVYTKDRRMKKQDAYTQALEAYFRPLMTIAKS